jgi:hypothetical protein
MMAQIFLQFRISCSDGLATLSALSQFPENISERRQPETA